jgi:hypothetical protein
MWIAASSVITGDSEKPEKNWDIVNLKLLQLIEPSVNGIKCFLFLILFIPSLIENFYLSILCVSS